MRIRTLERKLLLPAPLDEVFEFFSRAENLQKLTPASLRFEILTPLPIQMRPGALIEYRLKLYGIPFRWLTEITVWEPGVRFVDVQRKGPYSLWEHEHVFIPHGDRTLMEDRLLYATPGGWLEPVLNRLFVRPRVEQIFDHRERAVQALLEKKHNRVSLEFSKAVR